MHALITALLEAERAAEVAAADKSVTALERARLNKLAEFLRAEARSHLRRVA